jgi:integrase
MSVQRDPKGKGWVTRWLEHGRHRSRKFDRKSDAETWEREVKRLQQLGPLALQRLTDGGPTLNDWIRDHWTPEHGATLEPGTMVRYTSAYRLHIQPTFGQVPLTEITVSAVRAWQASLVQAGVTPGNIKKIRACFSSVLRHAAESEAMPNNPLYLVRPPKSAHRDGVRPLTPTTVEMIRGAILDPPARQVAASGPGQRARRAYEVTAPGTEPTRQRDALVVSFMAYAGLRPGEIRGLRFDDIGENMIRIERSVDDNGVLKSTKTGKPRSVKLLGALAQDIREYYVAAGEPVSQRSILQAEDGTLWTKSNWNMWLQDRWRPACRTVGLDPMPRPYDLRHSFASLLLAEGRQPQWVARQLGHSAAVLHSTYAHLIDEFEEATDVNAEVEIARARATRVASQLL